MPAILEIDVRPATHDDCSKAHVSVDGSEYLLVGPALRHRNQSSVTVVAGRWISDRRALGKTFWAAADLVAAYKRHGAILLEYARRMANWN